MPRDEAAHRTRPTPVDLAYQLVYRLGYRAARVYWGLRRPLTHGTQVALWHAGEVLLIRNSYVAHYGGPGGYVQRGERPEAAAVRELREEVGVEARPEQLVLALELTHDWDGKRDHVCLYELELAARPRVCVDHREVVAAGWYRPERALALPLFPPLRRVIERHGA